MLWQQDHHDRVSHLQLSPDGTALGTCSWDGTMRVSRPGRGVCVCVRGSMLLKEKSAWGLEVQTASDETLGGSLGMRLVSAWECDWYNVLMTGMICAALFPYRYGREK